MINRTSTSIIRKRSVASDIGSFNACFGNYNAGKVARGSGISTKWRNYKSNFGKSITFLGNYGESEGSIYIRK